MKSFDAQTYSKAPIVEAVIDIHFEMSSDVRFEDISKISDKLKDDFPIVNNITRFNLAVDINEGEAKNPPNQVATNVGLRLGNEDNSRILQIRSAGFAYSHLPPYTNWGSFKEEAKKFWLIFLEECRPVKITRCAVRYINRIDIPTIPIEIEDYLNIYPKLPENIPQDVYGMQMHLEMPQEDIKAMAIVNQAIVEPAIRGGISIIVDIDIFEERMDLEPDSPLLWDSLELMRCRKNMLFESFITDKTRELIR